MPRNEQLPVTPAVLTWARERAGLSIEEMRASFAKAEKWELGAEAPTYPQLEALSDKLKVPVAVFFFPRPPNVPPISETFRTLPDAQFANIPRKVRMLLRKAKAFQLSLVELNEGRNWAERLITRDLQLLMHLPMSVIARRVRDYLGVTLDEQSAWRNQEDALNQWRDRLFGVGVYVFKDQFRTPDYSGFCLYDTEFPLIYVNNSTSKSRQTFTLFHELAHLLFHTSGIDTETDAFLQLLPEESRRIEVFCNKFAGEFLVPATAFTAAMQGRDVSEATVEELAGRFKVSREVVYRRFLERSWITAYEYEEAVERWARQTGGAGESSGNFYNSQIAYLGRPYIRKALQQYYRNRIDENQLADYLNIAPKNVSKFEEQFTRGGA
jgi:Zn-dependent peptidase ImmA (M78 family)/transcriptional regulator with XRE-family HTH domain